LELAQRITTCFHYLIAFLRDEILAKSDNRLAAVDELVDIFARVLLRPGECNDPAVLDGCAQFLRNFLLVPAEEVVPRAGTLI